MYIASFLSLLGFMETVLAGCPRVVTLGTVIPSEKLVWLPCYDGFHCAKLLVPLDYQKPEIGQAAVPLVKYSARSNSSSGDYQGMILLNPGGPGQSGVEQALDYGPLIHNIVGSNFDVIGFDPRGIYHSEPLANCSTPTSNESRTLDSRSVPRMKDDYYNSWIDYGKDLGKACAADIGGELDAGPHMSTATTCRDMISIVDAFDATADGRAAAKPSGLVNYYGISYGTYLGQTFASMFPDRVGNFVLDGVVSPEGYLANYTWSSVTHLDGVISAFFIHCHEVGPDYCSLHTGSSPRDIYDRFNRSFAQLDAETAVSNNYPNASDTASALLLLKIALLTTANYPLENFSLLPDILVGLEHALAQHSIEAWIEQAKTLYGNPAVDGTVNAQYSAGVLCSDMENRWYNKTLDDLQPLLEDLNHRSIVGDIWIKSMLPCLGWSIEATETFQGPFGGDTTTPILFVGNTYDPVTPVDNAISAAPKFKDAETLIIDGMGHTVIATGNLCAMSRIVAYFQTGAMPGIQSFCKFERATLGITGNGTLEEIIAHHGLSNLVG